MNRPKNNNDEFTINSDSAYSDMILGFPFP